jgi:hypothetical protein
MQATMIRRAAFGLGFTGLSITGTVPFPQRFPPAGTNPGITGGAQVGIKAPKMMKMTESVGPAAT